MTKVKFFCPWNTTENITYRVIVQFLRDSSQLSNIEFVTDDSYDIAVHFNHLNSVDERKRPAYVFPHEPSWAGSHQKNYSEHDNVTVFGFDKNLYSGNCIEERAYTFYGGRGNWVDSYDFWSYENLHNKTFEKKKNISSTITSLNSNNCNAETCLYKQRYSLAKYIKENIPFVHMFAGWDENYPSPHKKDAVSDYRFSVVIENEHSKNWITEKFYDCILTDTIPIYFGCKNVEELHPEGGYILIKDVENLNEIDDLLTYINKNSEEVYHKNISKIRQIKEKYYYDNLLTKIISLI